MAGGLGVVGPDFNFNEAETGLAKTDAYVVLGGVEGVASVASMVLDIVSNLEQRVSICADVAAVLCFKAEAASSRS